MTIKSLAFAGIGFFVAGPSVFAQDAMPDVEASSESGGVFVQPFFSIPMLSLEIQQPQPDDKPARTGTYRPHTVPDFGISVSYAGLTLALSAPIASSSSSSSSSTSKDDSDKEEHKTPTRYRDYKFDYFRDYWGITLGWHEYQGFDGTFTTDKKDSDSDDSDTNKKGDEVARADLRKQGRFVDFTIIPLGEQLQFSKGIQESAPAGFKWSPVVQFGYDYEVIKADQPLIPKAYASVGDADVTGGAFESYVLGGGAAAKFRKGSWQTTGFMVWGRTLENAHLQMASTADIANSSHMSERFGFRWNATYLLDRWVSGLALNLDDTTLHLQNAKIKSTVGTVVVSLGTTFGAKKS